MNRRIFFRNGLMGALGLSFPTLHAAPISFFQPENIGHWLRRLTRATGLQRRRWPSGLDEPRLQSAIDSLETCLAERSYYREADELYAPAGSEGLFFYPLWLRHSTAGLTDLVVPVLARQADRSWQTVITLSGYQVEALARAAGALTEAGLPPGELLLPVRPIRSGEGLFETRRGRVQIVTRTQAGQAFTSMTVLDGQQVVFEAGFSSQHGLTSEAQTA